MQAADPIIARVGYVKASVGSQCKPAGSIEQCISALLESPAALPSHYPASAALSETPCWYGYNSMHLRIFEGAQMGLSAGLFALALRAMAAMTRIIV